MELKRFMIPGALAFATTLVLYFMDQLSPGGLYILGIWILLNQLVGNK